MTGITAAIRLAEAGHSVDLYEARDHLGGLSDAYSWDGLTWDRFYHVVLSTDERLLRLLRELGLADRIFWRQTKSGFFGDGRLASMSSIGDFLTFPFLSLWQKFRLGLGILLCIGIKDADKLDRLYVREWLMRVFGRRVYERIWDPLLRSKLGEARHQTSAAFIWATITRLHGARSGESKTEQMGHVRGGYATILAAIAGRLESLGVRVRIGAPVDAVEPSEGGEGRVKLRSGYGSESYDKVLLTVPAPAVLRITGRSVSDGPYWRALADAHYLGVLCLFVVLDRRLSPYYVTNLLDASLPFTGIIETTNIADTADFDGRHLVYLPKYVSADDPLLFEPDQAVTEALLAGLRKVHPELPAEAVLHTRLFRELHVQPLQEVSYLDQARGIQTPIHGIYLANSTMLYNSTLNNNAAIALAESAVEVMTDHKGAVHG